MSNEKMTAEQRYWYLKGYIDCFIPDLARNLNVSEDEARKVLGDMLSQVIKMKK
jgi:hypothetical protein